MTTTASIETLPPDRYGEEAEARDSCAGEERRRSA